MPSSLRFDVNVPDDPRSWIRAEILSCMLNGGLTSWAVAVAPDEIEFRRVLAAPYPTGRGLRDALDIEVNGISLARSLEAAPFDVALLRSGNVSAAWSRTSTGVPILNCTCGDVECGGFYVDVVADDQTVTWTGPALERALTFDRPEFVLSLNDALRE